MQGSPAGGSRNALAAIVSFLDEAFGDFSFTELATLLAVCEHEGLSVSSVARVCRFTEATASRTVRKMAPADLPGALPPARGLLTLARAPNDNRSRYVFLTARGRALCQVLDAMMSDARRVNLVRQDLSAGLPDQRSEDRAPPREGVFHAELSRAGATGVSAAIL